MKNLIGYLPEPNGKSRRVVISQDVSDIVALVKHGVKDSIPAASAIAFHFDDKSAEIICKRIFKFLRANVLYEKETPERQTIKSLSRLLVRDRRGDCKHFATAAGAILSALKVPFVFRLAAFGTYKEFSHIYVVAFDGSREIVLDPVLENFGAECAYHRKKDVNP